MPSPTPYATNTVGAQAGLVDFTQPYTPTTMMTHGGTIVVNGNIIGRINNWHAAGAYNREGTHVYEVNYNTWGVPVDYVPGRATGFNLTMTRSEVWDQELELTLGYTGLWNNLTEQTFPFVAQEFLFKGALPYRTWSYFCAWFTEKNPSEFSAESNGLYQVTCGMAYISRRRTS
jgi:hypothetical protein